VLNILKPSVRILIKITSNDKSESGPAIGSINTAARDLLCIRNAKSPRLAVKRSMPMENPSVMACNTRNALIAIFSI